MHELYKLFLKIVIFNLFDLCYFFVFNMGSMCIYIDNKNINLYIAMDIKREITHNGTIKWK